MCVRRHMKLKLGMLVTCSSRLVASVKSSATMVVLVNGGWALQRGKEWNAIISLRDFLAWAFTVPLGVSQHACARHVTRTRSTDTTLIQCIHGILGSASFKAHGCTPRTCLFLADVNICQQ